MQTFPDIEILIVHMVNSINLSFQLLSGVLGLRGFLTIPGDAGIEDGQLYMQNKSVAVEWHVLFRTVSHCHVNCKFID